MRNSRLFRIGIALFLGCLLILTKPAAAQSTAAPLQFAEPSNVVDLRAGYALDDAAEKMLRDNGFVVLDAISAPDLHAAYPKHPGTRYLFVTTDAMLQLWYDMYRSLLISTERRAFHPQLCVAVSALVRRGTILQQQARDPSERADLRSARIALGVAERLLQENVSPPADIRPEIEALVGKVLAHTEYNFYPGEDFTQYTVRGHYAETPEQSRYFRGALWLSRRFYPVGPVSSSSSDRSLRTALALAAIVRAEPDVRTHLRALLTARQALVGVPNAISVEQLIAATDRTLGAGWTLPEALKQDSLAHLRRELQKPEYPRASVQTLSPGGPGSFPHRIVALLPNFAVPDSVLFQRTIDPEIPGRSLPSGLEVAAALGLTAARARIVSEDPQGAAVLAAVDRERGVFRDDGKSLYAGWLHALSTLAKVDPNAPEFMRSGSWQNEQLNTCLSGWAQLRHAYILYAAQVDSTMSETERLPTALVEANPPFYRALAELAERTRTLLVGIGALSPHDAPLLRELERRCRDFAVYAQAELDGKLTEKQATEIDGFGEWLEKFPSTAGPLVADVATGLQGEVLHAATGYFHPILVMPGRSSGPAYVGWTSSYYEFSRPNHDRMTDARWQAELASVYLRPTRPAWTGPFVAAERGPEWDARTPLRAAEQLILDHRTEEGLALLRRTVETHPDTTLATEAQFRIGKYYYDTNDPAHAETALRRCLRLPGCEAFDQAERLLNAVSRQRDAKSYQERQTIPQQRRITAQYGQLRAAIIALKRANMKRSTPDATAERRLASRLLRELPWDSITGDSLMIEAQLLREAVAACRTAPCRDALGYAALVAGQSVRLGLTDTNRAMAALVYYRQASSPALRAAALGLALRSGYLADRPQEALKQLRPYLKSDLFTAKSDAALTLLMTSSQTTQAGIRPQYGARPEDFFMDGAKPVRNSLVKSEFYAGHVEAAIEIAQLFPQSDSNVSDNDDLELEIITSLWNALHATDTQAIRILAVSEGLEAQGKKNEAIDKRLTITDRFPRSILAPFVLGDAAHRLQQQGDVRRANTLLQRLEKDYPESFPALCIKANAAFETGDTDRARAALDRCLPFQRPMSMSRSRCTSMSR